MSDFRDFMPLPPDPTATFTVDLTGLPPEQAFALGEMTSDLITAAEARGYDRAVANFRKLPDALFTRQQVIELAEAMKESP